MHRVGRWFDRGRSANASEANLDAEAEARNMEVALRAAELIMDDDIKGAEEHLANGTSAFHKLARGTLGFMKATLGFEQEIMRQATDTLADAESSAYQFLQKAQHDPHAFSSTIYEKGSEFALCQAEAQIMAAVVGVLNESVTESLKGFYKMRKAYFTLDSLAKQEQNFMKIRSVRSLPVSRQHSSESLKSMHSTKSSGVPDITIKPAPAAPATITTTTTTTTTTATASTIAPTHPSALRNAETIDDVKDEESDEDEFFDVDDSHPKTVEYQGRIDTSSQFSPVEDKMQHLAVSDMASSIPSLDSPTASRPTTPNLPPLDPNRPPLLTADPDSDIFANSLDVFIHSGVNLMSGLINLMLSVIPPAFSRILSIIGFRGDRERGLRMLWQASRFSNINGGMAALIIFGWYNGLIGFCDIISDSDPAVKDDVNGFPLERLAELLVVMRQRYPKSYLWKLEEARMCSNRREVGKAIELLDKPGEKSQLKQLEALAMFELSLNAMNAHDYKLCAKSFIACVDLNQWSPALYYYAAASSYLQIYRANKSIPGKETLVEENRKLAEKMFKEAPTHVGKKKMMGKQLPFDTFVSRKVAKWTARSEAWGVPFIEAIGVSPIEEVILLWNGYKKMDQPQLEKSLANLAWSEDASLNPQWKREDLDEKAILTVLRASALRNLRRHDEAKRILTTQILSHDPASFKGHNKDDWTPPMAHYEMAVNFWMERREFLRRYGTTLAGPDGDRSAGVVIPEQDLKHDATIVAEAKKHVEKAKNWGSYELDTRIGMKITAAHAAILKWEAKHKDLIR